MQRTSPVRIPHFRRSLTRLTFSGLQKVCGCQWGNFKRMGDFSLVSFIPFWSVKTKRVGVMIWDLVGKVWESPNDKVWNCSSVLFQKPTENCEIKKSPPYYLQNWLMWVLLGSLNRKNDMSNHLHKRSSTAKKKSGKTTKHWTLWVRKPWKTSLNFSRLSLYNNPQLFFWNDS